MFWTAAAGLFCAILLLDAASGRFDLLACAGAHADAANGYGAREIAIGKHLCRTLAGADESRLHEGFPGDFRTLGHTALEVAQTNDLMLDPKDIRETTLREPSRERHLATLELWLATARTVM